MHSSSPANRCLCRNAERLAAKNCTGCSRRCLELSRGSSCDSSPSHALCCLIWDPTQPAQPINPAYATHHYLVLVASIVSDLLDKIVILAALGSAMWWPLRLLLHSLPVISSRSTVSSCTTSIIFSEASHLSFVCSPPRQCTSASQTRTSRFGIISTTCVALRPTRSHPAQRRCALIVGGLVLPTSHHALIPGDTCTSRR